MMPVLYRFTFNGTMGHVAAYLLALGIVAYTTWNGWRTAVGPWDPKAERYKDPTRDQRVERARNYLFMGIAIAFAGLWYALPDPPLLGKGKGEGIPLHTYGILIGIGFLGAVSISAYLAEREWTGEKGKKMREQIFDLAFYVFIGGIGGSVLLFNIVNIKDVLAEGRPQMGMVFQGGLICAAGVAYWYGKKHDIDFLRLSDIGLPTESGYDLIEKIRALPTSASQVPAVALTAFATEKDRQRALASGFQMHLAKPVEPSALIQAIDQLVNGKDGLRR